MSYIIHVWASDEESPQEILDELFFGPFASLDEAAAAMDAALDFLCAEMLSVWVDDEATARYYIDCGGSEITDLLPLEVTS